MLKKLYIVQFMTKAFVLTATLFVLMATVLVSCADEGPGDLYADEETDMDFSVTAAWQPGRVLPGTRSAEVPAIEDFVTIGGTVPYSAYPTSIWMEVNKRDASSTFTFTGDGEENPATGKAHPQHFIIAKGDFKKPNVEDDVPTGWLDYHNQFLIKNYGDKNNVSPKPFYKKSEMKSFVINAFWPWKREVDFPVTPSPLSASGTLPRHWTNDDVTTFSNNDFMYDHITNAEQEGRIEGHHLKLEMQHAMAMLRLYFQVDDNYDKVRKIVLRKVTIKKDDENKIVFNSAGNTAFTTIDEAPGFLLTTKENTAASKLVAFCYMKPSHDYDETALSWTNCISNGTPLTFQCTYDIYDKDEPITADHCTRRNVTATNTTTLKMAFNSSVVDIKAGHYYDLKITINPDYLYVLAEHDNKHITIN